MLILPKTTEFNKRIPKQKFYENLTISPALKKIFVEQVKSIYWRNKIAPTTMNIAVGVNVVEIEIFEIKLNSPNLDESFFRQIDKEIPYHIIFILEYEGKQKAVIGYKEESTGNNAFKVNRYYSTDWQDAEQFSLKAEGLSIDTIYENFIRQILLSGRCSVEFENWSDELSFAGNIQLYEKKEKLQKEIARLEKLARAEKQPKKKFELVQKLTKLKTEINNG